MKHNFGKTRFSLVVALAVALLGVTGYGVWCFSDDPQDSQRTAQALSESRVRLGLADEDEANPRPGSRSSRNGDEMTRSRESTRKENKSDPASRDLAIRSRTAALAEADGLGLLDPGEEKDEFLAHLARAWAALGDIQGVMAWIESLEKSEREKALAAVAEELSRTQPIEALRIAVDLSAGDSRDDLLRRSVANWADSEPKEALAWILEQEDGPDRDLLLAGMLPLWSETDPVAAATMSANEMNEGKLLSDTVVGIVQRWQQTDPSAAKAWVDQFPPGVLKDVALELIELSAR